MNEFDDHEGLQEHLKKMLEHLPKEIRVLEYPIEGPQMRLYQSMVKKYRELPDDPSLLEEDVLSIEDEDIYREVLVKIAGLGSVEAFRHLEKLEREPMPKWQKQWTQMALMQCQIQLENELRDEPIGFIATGLGGKENKIRYYFAVKSEETFDEGRGRFVKQIFEAKAKEYNAEIEEVVEYDHFLQFKLLLPFNHSLVNLVANGIKECDFLDEEFFITNMKEPTKDDLDEWSAGEEEEDDDDLEIDLDLDDDDDFFE